MRPRGRQFHLNILFILVSYFWEGRANAGRVENGSLDYSDELIRQTLVARRLSFNNDTVDKCTNFYEYACGAAPDVQPLLPFELSKNLWHEILSERLKALLDADITYRDKPAIRKVKLQYQLCMDFDKRDKEGFEKLKFLIQKDSNFPMIMPRGSWDFHKLQVLEPQKYDPSLFSVRIRNNKITIGPYDVSLYGRFLSNLKNASRISHPVMYKSFIKQIFQDMGLLEGVIINDFEKDLDDVMRFRYNVHSNAWAGKIGYTRMTVGRLQDVMAIHFQFWPQFNWETFLRDVFVNASGVDINPNTQVTVAFEYMLMLKDLMQLGGPSTVANHIKLHFLETYLSATSGPLVQYSESLAAAAYTPTPLFLRKNHTSSRSPLNSCMRQPHILRALNYMYLEEWFPKKSRDAALGMVRKIKDALWDNMKVTNIISSNVTERLRDQIESVTVILGSDEKYTKYDLLHPLYGYEVPEDHLSSVMNARRYLKEYEYSMLNNPKNNSLGIVDILREKPHVSAEKGVIDLPIGYLHRWNLSPTLPEEMSYATLGYKISLFLNEVIIKQGFPSRKFSRDIQWYDGDLDGFSNKTACIENQYHSQFLKERPITDKEPKEGEYDEITEQALYNNAAFQIAHRAFDYTIDERRSLNKGPIPIRYMNQEFVEHWATMYCMSDKLNESNSPEWRVNNVLRNWNLFGTHFDCRDGAPMILRDRCTF